MKNSPNDTIGNRTRDLPTCSAGLQPTSAELNVLFKSYCLKISNGQNICASVDESKYLAKYSDMPEDERPGVDPFLYYSPLGCNVGRFGRYKCYTYIYT